MEHADGIRVVGALRVTRCRPSSTPLLPGVRVCSGYRRGVTVGCGSDGVLEAIGVAYS